MKTKILNLALVLGLALVVGFSFTTTPDAFAQQGTSTVPCTETIIGPPPPGGNQMKRCCDCGGCPWAWIYGYDVKSCTITNQQQEILQ